MTVLRTGLQLKGPRWWVSVIEWCAGMRANLINGALVDAGDNSVCIAFLRVLELPIG